MGRLWRIVLVIFMLFGITQYLLPPEAQADQVLGGVAAEGNLEITVQDTGLIGIRRYISGAWQNQVFGWNSKDSRLQLNGAGYAGGYFSGTAFTLVSNTQVSDSLIRAIWTAGGTRITQEVTYLPGSAYVGYKWIIANESGAALSDLRFFHGEDTYFYNSDNGAGYWDAANTTIGVQKTVGATLQRMSLQAVTLPYAHDSLNYYTMRTNVNAGALTNTLDATEATDNGYALEWRLASLANGASWQITAYEKFADVATSTISVTAPTLTTCDTGSTCNLTFTVNNLSASSVSVALAASVNSSGWGASVSSPASPVTIAAGAAVSVTVPVSVPAGIADQTTAQVTLNATASGSAAVSDTATVQARLVYPLTINSANPASGVAITVSPADVKSLGNGTTPFSRTYLPAASVTLTAPASAGSNLFSSWSGCTSTSGTSCTVSMTAAKTVTANYVVSTYPLTVALAGIGSGSVTPSVGTLIWTGKTGTASYDPGTSVVLTAAAGPGSVFTSWSGCTSSSGATCTVSMTAAKNVTATFNGVKILLLDNSLGEMGQALDKIGYSYTRLTAATLATATLSSYDIIMTAWMLPADIVTVLINRKTEIASWTSAGGRVFTSSALNADSNGVNDWSWVPKSVTPSFTGHLNDVTVVATNHNLMKTPHVLDSAAMSNWSNAYHNVWTAYDPSYELIAKNSSNQAIILAASYGSGMIVVSGSDPEYHTIYGPVAGQYYLENLLTWANAAISSGKIAGTVTDSSTATGIAGVTVTATGPSTATAVTAADGSYSINYLSPGTYALSATKTGYQNGSKSGVVVTIGVTTTANMTMVSTSGAITGTVVNATTGAGIVGATVAITGPATRTITTGTGGSFSATGLSAGTYTITSSATGYIADVKSVTVATGGTVTTNIPLSPVMANNEYRVVLSWGATPLDLDLHAYVPTGTGCYHVFYDNMGSATNMPYTMLDVDDVSGYGPETITVKQLLNGTYQFWVDNYSDTPDITTSGATVKLYSGATLVRTFTIPATPTGNGAWHVFDFTPSTGQIATVNTLQTALSGSCTQGATVATLTVDLLGDGAGTVTSTPQGTSPTGISCTAGRCTTTFPLNTQVSLLATPDTISLFKEWSGHCTGSGNCDLLMVGPKYVQATIDAAAKAKINKTGYATLTTAYAAAGSSATILALDTEFIENLNMNSLKNIILKGGYTGNYQTKSGMPTELKGVLTIGSGSLTVENLTIK